MLPWWAEETSKTKFYYSSFLTSSVVKQIKLYIIYMSCLFWFRLIFLFWQVLQWTKTPWVFQHNTMLYHLGIPRYSTSTRVQMKAASRCSALYLRRRCYSNGRASAWCLWSAVSRARSYGTSSLGGPAEILRTVKTACRRDPRTAPRITCTHT